jgi:hypothetical protein
MATLAPLPPVERRSKLAAPRGRVQRKAIEAVARGGWFVALDQNGEHLVVRLPPRVERGS